ncbi:hypothetical protein BGX34_004764 [Mortierella sp. NVP85]|nr:hypothetical protein BGX34_004764 [Mortierella sp. NVP85]
MKLGAILSTLAAATLVSAGKFHHLTNIQDFAFVPNSYIIEIEDDIIPTQTFNIMKISGMNFDIRNDLPLFSAFSLKMNSEHDGESIAQIQGVKNVWRVTLHKIPRTFKSKAKPTDPEVVSLHTMTGVDIVHKKYKLTGKGIKVGVIDTGLDYKHPAFAAPGATEGCFGKGCRITHGYDFVGDEYDGITGRKPDDDPMDCEGHGTHVAGIIGANALNIKSPKPPQPFVGVAPEVTFGAYRVFGCAGDSPDDVILAAMQRASKDGMDVINLSLGSGSDYKYNAVAVLGDKLVKSGVAVIAAAGNDGSDGVWMVSDTGLGDLATSAASFDNAYEFLHSFKYGDGDKDIPYSQSTTWGKPIKAGNAPNVPAGAILVPIFKGGSLADGCDAAHYTTEVKGNVVLALGDFSKCGSAGRGALAKAAGAAGMLIQATLGLDNLAGVAGFPMASIEHRSGDALLAAWKKSPTAIFTWSKDATNFVVEGGGAPSGFSSYGIDGELRTKPDLAAPGGNILSTYPQKPFNPDEPTDYAVLSGTSMATPYLAGSHALYMQAKKSKPHGDVIRQALKNTATISSEAESKTKASVAKQGAGLVNMLRAITTTTSISPDHIDLLDSKNFKKNVIISIKNFGKQKETYKLSHVPADTLNSYPDQNIFPLPTPIIENHYATVVFSANEIEIPAGKTAKITLSFKEPKKGKASQFPIYSGFVVATPKSKNGVPVSVPYTGLKGDVSKVPILDKKYIRVVVSDEKFNLSPINHTKFDFEKQRPTVLTRLGSHTPNLMIRVSKDGKFVGFIDTVTNGPGFGHRGRNANLDSEGEVYTTPRVWNGLVYTKQDLTLKPQRVPDGKYSIEIAAQKKFTYDEYPKNYERMKLGTIEVKTNK